MPDDKKKNSSVDVNKIISQAHDLLKALDSEGETSDPTVEPVLTGGSKAKSSQAISSDEKGSSFPVDIKANAKDSEPPLFEITNSGKLPAIFLVLIVLLPIGNMLYTNSQNKSQKPYMSYQQILREERAKIAKEKAEKEKSEEKMKMLLETAHNSANMFRNTADTCKFLIIQLDDCVPPNPRRLSSRAHPPEARARSRSGRRGPSRAPARCARLLRGLVCRSWI